MNIETLALISFILAAIPCGLFLLNLFVYRPLANPKLPVKQSLSVLIPARNEEQNIHATLTAVLANRDCDFEAIVLDDHSTDATTQIVAEIAEKDSRVRLESAPPLPDGWCGKQHACHVLAKRARHPLLVFIDADVRLSPDALARMAHFMEHSEVALASGVPRQELGTFLERLLIPLIHFVLLGFLPMHAMRWTRWAAFSAGCGQLFIARRDAYAQCGGHSMLRDSLHDGVKLPRVFRKAGFRTDLFDATDLATCRMYQTNGETWCGLGKNATEGLAAPATILPMSVLLLCGQTLPFVILFFADPNSVAFNYSAGACLMAWLPRLLAARLFKQPWWNALAHPLGIVLLLGIQWQALWRKFLNQPMKWKGRNYMHSKNQKKLSVTCWVIALAGMSLFSPISVHAAPEKKPTASTNLVCPNLALQDQFGTNHTVHFPTTQPTILLVADREGSAQIEPWVKAVKKNYDGRVSLIGVANVGGAPGLLQNMIRNKFRTKLPYSILLDWSGALPKTLHCTKDVVNVFVLDISGRVIAVEKGECLPDSVQKIFNATDTLLPKVK